MAYEEARDDSPLFLAVMEVVQGYGEEMGYQDVAPLLEGGPWQADSVRQAMNVMAQRGLLRKNRANGKFSAGDAMTRYAPRVRGTRDRGIGPRLWEYMEGRNGVPFTSAQAARAIKAIEKSVQAHLRELSKRESRLRNLGVSRWCLEPVSLSGKAQEAESSAAISRVGELYRSVGPTQKGTMVVQSETDGSLWYLWSQEPKY